MNGRSLDVRLRDVFDAIVDHAPEPGNAPHEGPPQRNRPDGRHQRWLVAAAVVILVAGVGGLVALSSTSESDRAVDGDVSDSSVARPTGPGSVSPADADPPDATSEPTVGGADADVTECGTGRCFVYVLQQGDVPAVVEKRFCTTSVDLVAANGWTDIATGWPSRGATVLVPVDDSTGCSHVDAVGSGVTISAPPDDAAVLAIGDSVMLGAAPRLTAAGVLVDAEASRAFVNGLDLVSALVEQGRIGGPSSSIETVIVHLGGNGSIDPIHLDQMMTLLSDVDVVVLTNGIDRDYAAVNDDQIRRLPAAYPNVSVIDWDVLRDECVGECFFPDDIHLRPAGQEFYADLVIAELEAL